MREWLDADSRLFPKQSRSSAAPISPLQIVAETSPTKAYLERQLAKRALYQYLDEGDAILSNYRTELAQLSHNPADTGRLKQIADKLGRFCLDSDSWGFEDIYQVGQQLQHMALEMLHGLRTWDAKTTRLTAGGLDLLQNLLHECERDYDRQIAVANYLQNFATDEVV
jgi:hypothetical protein